MNKKFAPSALTIVILTIMSGFIKIGYGMQSTYPKDWCFASLIRTLPDWTGGFVLAGFTLSFAAGFAFLGNLVWKYEKWRTK